jgi:hypothetical protein
MVEVFQLAYKAIERIDDPSSSKALYSWRILGSLISAPNAPAELTAPLTAKVNT